MTALNIALQNYTGVLVISIRDKMGKSYNIRKEKIEWPLHRKSRRIYR